MEPTIELALRRQFDEAQRHALADPAKAELARIALQAIIDGTSEADVRAKTGQKTHKPKIDLVEVRRAAIEMNFRRHGFNISVPKPSVSNTTLKRWRRVGRELFYRPATTSVSYEAWMTAHGQYNHWTVANEADRAKVSWESTAAGYWFTAEIIPECPRINMSWNDLMASASGIRHLSLEEYALVYWMHRDLTGDRVDISTWCWLRTRFGRGALCARDDVGEVRVVGIDPDDLSIPYVSGGGRAVEVVENVA